MVFRRLVWTVLLLATCFSHADLRSTPCLLPDVADQLSLAKADQDRGNALASAAHAKQILIGDRIRYQINFSSIPAGERELCARALNQALAEWDSRTTGSVQFVRTDELAPHQIIVKFEPAVTVSHEPVAGYTCWKRTAEPYNATVEIRVHDLKGRLLSFEAIRQICAHEFGHVLGLDDSAQEGDVMGPLNIAHPVNGPTEKEALRVKNLRDEARRYADSAMAHRS